MSKFTLKVVYILHMMKIYKELIVEKILDRVPGTPSLICSSVPGVNN